MERIKGVAFLICLVSILAIPSGLKAQALITGIEVDSRDQGFGYLGLLWDKGVSEGRWVVGKVFTGHLRYTFRSNGKELDAKSTMVIPSIGLRGKRGETAFTLSAGADIRRTEKEKVGGGKERDDEVGLSLQGEVDSWWEGLRNMSIILSYSTIDNFFWGRLRLKGAVISRDPHHLLIGVEFVAMGNEDFNAFQVGGIVELMKIASGSILLKAGYKDTSETPAGGYTGLEIYIPF